MTLRTLSDLPKESLSNRRVLVRVDYNVPRKEGKILDTSRLEATLPTLRYLLKNGAHVILLSHFGRPQGQSCAENSLAFLVPVLSQLLEREVIFSKSLQGAEPPQDTQGQKSVAGSVTLLENLRFDPGEEQNDPLFVKDLARLGDLYVNDAFSVSHRAHGSVDALAKQLPSYAGFLFEQEISLIQKALRAPEKPLMALVAGSKVSTKLVLLETLLDKADFLVLGGGIANTFLVAQGLDMQHSLVEKEMIQTAHRILQKAPLQGCQILLPVDVTYAPDLSGGSWGTSDVAHLPHNMRALDIGPQTVSQICTTLKAVKTVVWNGPLGVFETPPFDQGTCQVAREIGRLTQTGGLFSIAGGGETVAALKQAGVAQQMSGLSLAGGAFLEALEGKELPGVAVLLRSFKTPPVGIA